MHLNFQLPKGAILMAVGSARDGIESPRIEIAVYPCNINAGQGDEIMHQEGIFDGLNIRIFCAISGCGLLVRDGKITYTNPGLQNFVGRRVTLYRLDSFDVLLVVWEGVPRNLEITEMKSLGHRLNSLYDIFK